MKTPVALCFALATTGCATSHTAQLEARIHDLERENRDLRATVHRAQCSRVIDDSIAANTQFPYEVPFALGPSSLHAGDGITITDVHGTRPHIELGGIYLVRGRYNFASAHEAMIGLSVTAVRSGEGCTNGNGDRATKDIHAGSGTFELATLIPYQGDPHVAFYIDGHGAGGVYFHAQGEPGNEVGSSTGTSEFSVASHSR